MRGNKEKEEGEERRGEETRRREIRRGNKKRREVLDVFFMSLMFLTTSF